MNEPSIPHAHNPPTIAYLWLHEPTGTAGLQAIAQHPDHGPIPRYHNGITVLFNATNPDERITNNRSNWSTRTTSDVQAEAERLGWRVITRREAAELLITLGYTLRRSNQTGHLLHSDHADDLTWHNRLTVTGKPEAHQKATFVVRDTTSIERQHDARVLSAFWQVATDPEKDHLLAVARKAGMAWNCLRCGRINNISIHCALCHRPRPASRPDATDQHPR